MAVFDTCMEYARARGCWAPSRAAMKERKPIEEEPGPDHTIMGPRGGVLYLREKVHISNFISLYSKEKHPPTVSETLNGSPFFRAYVDLDFKSPPERNDLTREFKIRLANACTRALRRFYAGFEADVKRREGYAGAGATFQSILASRATKFKPAEKAPPPVAAGVGGGEEEKEEEEKICVASDGIHIIWPEVVVSVSEMLFISAAMREEARSEFGDRTGPFCNSWDDVFDVKVYRNGLRMIGCCKSTACPTCSEIREKADDELRNAITLEYTLVFQREVVEHGDRARAAAAAKEASERARSDFLGRVIGQHHQQLVSSAMGGAGGRKTSEMSRAVMQEIMRRLPASSRSRSRMDAGTPGCDLCLGRGLIYDNSPYQVELVVSGTGEVDERETVRMKEDKVRAIRRCSIRKPERDSCHPPWAAFEGCPPPAILSGAGAAGGERSGARKRGRAEPANAFSGDDRFRIPPHDPRHAIVLGLVQSYEQRFRDVRIDRIEVGPSPDATRGGGGGGVMLVGNRRRPPAGGTQSGKNSSSSAATAVASGSGAGSGSGSGSGAGAGASSKSTPAPQNPNSNFSPQGKAYAFFAYTSGPGSGSCMNLNRKLPHNTSRVYFVVTNAYITQRCMNASCKPDRRSGGPCRRWTSSPRIPVPEKVADILFPRGSVALSAKEFSSLSLRSAGAGAEIQQQQQQQLIDRRTMALFGKDAKSFKLKIGTALPSPAGSPLPSPRVLEQERKAADAERSRSASLFSQVVFGSGAGAAGVASPPAIAARRPRIEAGDRTKSYPLDASSYSARSTPTEGHGPVKIRIISSASFSSLPPSRA